MDMGRFAGNKYTDLANMTERGRYQSGGNRGGSPAAVLAAEGFDPRAFQAGALHMGPCYFYAWERLLGFEYGQEWKGKKGRMHFTRRPPSWGELCIGGAMGLGLSQSLLYGKKCR